MTRMSNPKKKERSGRVGRCTERASRDRSASCRVARRAPLVVCVSLIAACGYDRSEPPPYDIDFEIPRTEAFGERLSDHGLYAEPMASREPAEGVFVYELASELFTDYAYKQRLLSIPEGTTITLGDDARPRYPEGTVLAKTFYYPSDMRDAGAPVRIIETRLLVKTEGIWNAATYMWNAEQTDAELLLEGTTTEVSWVDEAGEAWTTEYGVPHEGECVTCHQLGGESAFIGPTAQNLNRTIMRDDSEIDQLSYLRAEGALGEGDWESAAAVPSYRDESLSIEDRARAYLDINCAHCHRPDAWDEASSRDFDFRYTTPLSETGLLYDGDRVVRALEDGEMPYLGTTLRHDDGVALVVEYLRGL